MRRSTFLIRQHVPFNPSRGPSPRDRKKHARKAAVCRVRIETVGKEEDITPRPSTGVSFPRKGFATGTINKQLLLTLVLAADLDTRSIDRSIGQNTYKSCAPERASHGVLRGTLLGIMLRRLSTST